MFRRWMQKKGWHEVRPWQWRKSNLVLTAEDSAVQPLPAAQHILRQGWRQFVFQSWLNSKRHEAQELRSQYTERQLVAQFDRINLDATRTALLAATPAERSVLLGAAASPAWMGRATDGTSRPRRWVQDVSEVCPWCSACLGAVRKDPVTGQGDLAMLYNLGWVGMFFRKACNITTKF